MEGSLGVRVETKDPAERRAPLTPEHVRRLVEDHGITVVVQPSRSRVFPDADYVRAGATLSPDLSRCNLILGVKEVPPEDLLPGKAWMFFSHTMKGQPENMPMLRRLLELRGTLLDYERVVNERGRRLIAFGTYAGYAGMVNTVWALGRRLRWEGVDNPFDRIRRPHRYPGLDEVREALREVGRIVRTVGLPMQVVPLVVGITGQGRVSRGALEILKVLPTERLEPDDLSRFFRSGDFSARVVYRVGFHQDDLYVPRDPDERFDHYRLHRYPERYASRLEGMIGYLTVLVNGIYWEPRYPRILTKSFLRSMWAANPNPRLRILGDITCDVDGSLETTVRATTIDDPVYVYEPLKDRIVPGVEGVGPVIMAVDKLPTELPKQASESFGDALLPFLPRLAHTDFGVYFEDLDLPAEFRGAVIAYRGELREEFRHLESVVLGSPSA